MSNTLYFTDKQVADRFGVSRETIWRWRSTNDFPRPMKLSAGMTRRRLADIEAWEGSLQKGFTVVLTPGTGEFFGGEV